MVKKYWIKQIFLLLLFLLLTLPVLAAEEERNAPDLRVYMNNAETGSGNATHGGMTKVKVRVVYEGCQNKESYVLVLRLKDVVTGELCLFSDGSEKLSQPFTAEGKTGFFEFEFSFDATPLSGRTLAEIHTIEGMEAEYSMAVEEDSARIYIPAVSTSAVSESGEKTVLAGKNSVLCDVVSYKALSPGEEYRLITRLQDTETGKLICGDDGKPLSASSRFLPTEPDGQIASKITANLREHGNREIRILEELYFVPKTGNPVLLLSTESATQGSGTVFAQLTEIRILDEMYATPIAGVGVRVSSYGDGHIFEGISDAEGKCGFPLDAGESSSCTLTSIPEGYKPKDGSFDFAPTGTKESVALELTLLKKNVIEIFRTDAETGLPVQGIVTEVMDANGEYLALISTDENGIARFDANSLWEAAKAEAEKKNAQGFVLELSFKDYSAPSAYYPNENTWKNYIDENSDIMGLTFFSVSRRRPLTISVVDGRGKGIPGVEISIVGEDGSIEGRAVSDHEGRIFFTPNRTGDYVLVENEVPPGYVHFLGDYEFTVEENGEVSASLVIRNLSEDFTNSVIAAAVLTAIFLTVYFVTSFFGKKAIREKVLQIKEKK